MNKILLIDDHDLLREGIKGVLHELPGDFQFGDAATYAEGKRLAEEQRWSLAILDLALGMRDGLDLLKQFKISQPQLPVLVLSMYAEEEYARRSLRAGAAGYLSKSSRRKELLVAVRKILSGGRYVSSTLAEELVADLQNPACSTMHETLSDREFEVLRLIASGKTVGEIAAALSLSEKTISTYRARILRKTGFRTSAELTRYAITSRLA